MNMECEILTIDGKDYAIIREIDNKNTTYLFLSNVEDSNDCIIQKLSEEDHDTVVPLDNENEFNLACGLFFKNTIK